MPEYLPKIFVLTGIIIALTLVRQAWVTTPSSAEQASVSTTYIAGSLPLAPRAPDVPASEPTMSETLPKKTGTLVVRVIDGDTIEIEGGTRVRYIGVNTPESVDPRKKVQCFGKEAAAQNKELVEGKRVRLEADVEDKDRYGRLLRYVWLGDTMVNERIVQDGYAQLMTIAPNVKYVERFKAAQTKAREQKRGLWNQCRESRNK
ncbi:thermonuclease family protein [Candidatus Uhrbacteria bacterium]|nr:thermonuclease family protein [Candidatus Uhrbacteria bacterium]